MRVPRFKVLFKFSVDGREIGSVKRFYPGCKVNSQIFDVRLAPVKFEISFKGSEGVLWVGDVRSLRFGINNL